MGWATAVTTESKMLPLIFWVATLRRWRQYVSFKFDIYLQEHIQLHPRRPTTLFCSDSQSGHLTTAPCPDKPWGPYTPISSKYYWSLLPDTKLATYPCQVGKSTYRYTQLYLGLISSILPMKCKCNTLTVHPSFAQNDNT
jgi:hypothetical protein